MMTLIWVLTGILLLSIISFATHFLIFREVDFRR